MERGTWWGERRGVRMTSWMGRREVVAVMQGPSNNGPSSCVVIEAIIFQPFQRWRWVCF